MLCMLPIGLGCDGERSATNDRPTRAQVSTTSGADESSERDRRHHGGLASALPRTHEDLPESTFIRSEENRDPFAPMVRSEPVTPPPTNGALPIVLADRSLDEVRLVAIISGEGGSPRAMLVDPNGQGHTVQRGDLVGRPERVSRGPSLAPLEITWRVERIRPDRVIMTRHAPSHLGSPVVRVLRLHPEDGVARHAPLRNLNPNG